jgi:hypothetical protein
VFAALYLSRLTAQFGCNSTFRTPLNHFCRTFPNQRIAASPSLRLISST